MLIKTHKKHMGALNYEQTIVIGEYIRHVVDRKADNPHKKRMECVL